MNTYLLDNSVLTEILNDDGIVDSVIHALLKSKSRIVISFDTLTENFSGKIEFVAARNQRLKKLIDVLPPDQFIIAKTGSFWLTKELRNSGRLTNIPSLHNSQRWPGFLSLLDAQNFVAFHKSVEGFISEQRRYHDDLINRDREFREKGRKLLKPNEIHKLLNNFELNPRTFQLGHLASVLRISNRKAKKMMMAPSHLYRIHRAYLATFYLRSLGNAFDQYDKYPEFSFLRKIKGGNWTDLGIVAQSSAFDHLVSNDNDQRGICNFIQSKGLIHATAIDSDRFTKSLNLKPKESNIR